MIRDCTRTGGRLLALGLVLTAPCFACAQSAWVHYNPNHFLVYSNDNLGNHLIDYSYAGYGGGGVVLPTNEPVAQTLSVINGDNTAQIQNALNAAGNLPAGSNGVRCVVLLNPGTYPIAGTLSFSASGVVLRGAGPNTILDFTSTASSGTAINISGSSGATQASGSSSYAITDSYVPLGGTNFHLNSTSGLTVGTPIVVRRPWTTNWISAIGMTNYWTAGGHQNDAERTITAISGNQVTVDIPLPEPIEQQYCTGQVFPYTDSARVQQCGVESLRLISAWGLATTGDTNNFGWTGINFGSAKNCWVRNLAFDGCGVAVNASPYGQTKWCTVQDCTYSDGVNNGSARPAAFQIEGEMCLFQRLTGISGFEHMCQTADEAAGPNVFLNCNATGQDFDGGPHRYWATSLLTDNESGTVGNVHIVVISGGANGWGAGFSVFYNCHTGNHTIQCPALPNYYNWWIGGSGVNNFPEPDPGTYDADGTTVAPNSLYLEQLKERLGGVAVENIGYPLFTLSAAPATQLIRPGTNTNFNVSVGDPTLMSNLVALSVSGLPAGAGVSWNTNSVTGAGSATLTVTASNSLAPGTYALTIVGASAGLTHTVPLLLSVGSFSLAASPVAQAILAGSGTNYLLTLTTNNGFTGSVNFGLSGLPANAGGGFSPPLLSGNGNSTLSVTTASNTPPGSYPLTISSSNGSGVASTLVTLTITVPVASPGSLVWTNGATDLDWSSAANWTNTTSGGYGPPGVPNDVVFTNFSTVANNTTVNNLEDGITAIDSLTYENTSGYQVTEIAPGATLSIAGTGGLLAGTESDLGVVSVNAVITGADGALVVSNTSANVTVRQASATSGSVLKATLDLSGLGSFQADIARLELGALGANARPCGVLYLAKTNWITASGSSPAIILGGQGEVAGGNGGNGSLLYLGQTNVINANGISVATVKQGGCSMLFNPSLAGANPVAFFRGADGVSPVPAWFIADSGSAGGTVNTSGTNDFSGGTVNALVNNLTVARSSTGSGTGNPSGTLTLAAGVMSIGTLQIGLQGASSANYATATVNVNGNGLLLVSTNLVLAQVAGGTGVAGMTGTLNVNGGTVQCTNISGGGGISFLNLNSGTLDLQAGNAFPGGLMNVSSLNVGTNGASAPALLENAGGILVSNVITIAGNGTLAGSLFVTSPGLVVNGALAPGVEGGVGAITNSGNITLGAGGNLMVTMQDAAAGPLAGWSFLQTAGQLGVSSSSTNPFALNPVSFNPDNSGLVTNFNNNTNYSWVVVTAAVGITNFNVNKFTVNSALFQNDLAGGCFFTRTNGNSLVLAFTNNHPPVAGTVVQYLTGATMVIPISTLASVWSDPDGDPVILAGVTASSADGVNNVSTDGNEIYYTNVTGAADALFYTVQDVRTNPPAVYRAGDTQRTATGEILLLPPPVFTGVLPGNGRMILSGAGGIADGVFYLLGATNLALPVNLWRSLATNTFDGSGAFHLTNSAGTNQPEFFRLQMPP